MTSMVRAHALERAEVQELREREMRIKGLSDKQIKKKLLSTRKRYVKVGWSGTRFRLVDDCSYFALQRISHRVVPCKCASGESAHEGATCRVRTVGHKTHPALPAIGEGEQAPTAAVPGDKRYLAL